MNIAMVSPGWPIEEYPNGIIAYVATMKKALDATSNVWVLSSRIAKIEHNNSVVLIPKKKDQSNWNKLVSKIPGPYTEIFIYNNLWSRISYAINEAIVSISPKPDIIEIEESFGIAKWLTKYTDIPIVTRLHGTWFIHGPIDGKESEADFKIRVKSEGYALELSQGVTSPSINLLAKVRDFYNLPLEHAAVIPNPISPVTEENRWITNPKKQIILFVGRFDAHKGGDLVIRAFHILAIVDRDLELFFVGPDRGVIDYGNKLNINEYISKYIKESSIRKRIHILGAQNPKEIKLLRKQASVTVMASRYENFSMSLLEAIATGCPVVASNVGGNSEIIIDNHTGILVEPESPEALAFGISELLNDKEKMTLISQNAINDSLKRFHPEVIAAKTLAYYKKIL